MAPESLDAWQNLGALATSAVRGRLWDSLADPARFDRFSLRVGKLFIDFSKQFVTDDVMKQLVSLAEGSNLEEAIEALFAGQRVNVTENRAALHTALRAPLDQRPNAVAQPIEQAQAKFFDFVRAVRDARWTGFSGRPIKHVVHIGIGGSQLGPQLAVEALRGADTSLSVRFLANVDGHAIVRTLHGLDPRETLVIVASKSFTTLETGLNAESVKSWFIERTCDPTAMARHFVAVTENVDAASKFGIPPANCFEMWDWVGGRYSLWSAVGLPIALALGEAQFRDMLRGAHAVDKHFRNTPIARPCWRWPG